VYSGRPINLLMADKLDNITGKWICLTVRYVRGTLNRTGNSGVSCEANGKKKKTSKDRGEKRSKKKTDGREEGGEKTSGLEISGGMIWFKPIVPPPSESSNAGEQPNPKL